MKKLTILDWVTFVLVIIGGLNWGAFGINHYDLVAMTVGDTTIIGRAIYIIIGLSAVYLALISPKLRKS